MERLLKHYNSNEKTLGSDNKNTNGQMGGCDTREREANNDTTVLPSDGNALANLLGSAGFFTGYDENTAEILSEEGKARLKHLDSVFIPPKE